MGRLVKGQWQVEPVNPKTADGEYQRQEQHFRDLIEPSGRFKPETNRYHLYISLACPWAHRALIFRSLKGLEDHLSVSTVGPWMLDDGWEFKQDFPETTGDSLYDLTYLRELYVKADANFTGRVTVPVLWDKKEKTIVNNESEEIIRILNSAFDSLTSNKEDFYPIELREEIHYWNEQVYEPLNNGVYKTGFATTKDAYEKNYQTLFQALDKLEAHLKDREYLVGERLTEADIRLFTTLVRFDCVYYSHFKCNRQRIRDYKELHRYTLSLYNHPKIKPTVNFDHIKTHYFGSHETLNPTRIIPLGPSPLV
jgi:glutathionyl-hydroquinone reductase